MAEIDPETVRPKITQENPVDQFGTRWETAMVDEQGQVLAGYSEHGTFHAYVDMEYLFVYSQTIIAYLSERAQP